jgi:hypothetical protein
MRQMCLYQQNRLLLVKFLVEIMHHMHPDQFRMLIHFRTMHIFQYLCKMYQKPQKSALF